MCATHQVVKMLRGVSARWHRHQQRRAAPATIEHLRGFSLPHDTTGYGHSFTRFTVPTLWTLLFRPIDYAGAVATDA